MNTYSHICRFINEHPSSWEALLKTDYKLKIKTENNYAIFNYGYDADFSNPIVQEARGIIIDTETLEVVSWPFRKFGNHTESYADPIDWAHAKVQEKVDGSIMKLWYDFKKQNWQFSTNATIRAESASVSEESRLSFYDLICKSDNFSDIPFDTLDKNITYIFELVSPMTKVVVPYKSTMLYHIGTRHNLTGLEMDMDIGIQKPKMYPIHSLAECVETAIQLNQTGSEDIIAEGFVVVDANWNRVKVKSPDYIAKHHLLQMKSIPKKECIEKLINHPQDIRVISEANPELIPIVKFYDYHLARLMHLANRIGLLANRLYEEYSCDRNAVAKVIKNHPLAWVGFKCIEGNRKGSEVLIQNPIEKILKLIPDYQEDDLSSLFLQK